jgi:hypothetical protein
MDRPMRIALLAGLAACWTGPVAAPEPVHVVPTAAKPLALEVTLERSACMGMCPTYTVTVHGDGLVSWLGIANVAEMGERTGRVSRKQLGELDRMLASIRFFELDDQGNLPAPRAFKFSMCSDTPHAIITVKRGSKLHRVDDPQCGDEPAVEPLELLVDRLANTRHWIGN